MVKRSSTNRALFAVTIVLFFVLFAFASGFVAASLQPRRIPTLNPHRDASSDGGPLSVFEEAWGLVSKDFFGSLPPNRQRAYGAASSLLSTLNDPYTALVEPAPRRLEQGNLRGSHGGIGVTLTRDADGRVVLTPLPDSPAAAAGILHGDVLLMIDGVAITPELQITDDVEARIRGDVGTIITLKVYRDGDTHSFTITRQAIMVPSVTWHMLEGPPSSGYIRIASFTDRTPGEFGDGLDRLLEAGATGLVLDLRDNAGGLLQASIEVADEFFDAGPLLYEAHKTREEKAFLANEGGRASSIPLVVLVNQGTASASEIVAGAIQDRGRGMLIGEPTFGKGSVQLIFDLSDGSSLHVTAARWYTPERHQLDGVGLMPDLIVEADQESGTDVQLEKAISVLLKIN